MIVSSTEINKMVMMYLFMVMIISIPITLLGNPDTTVSDTTKKISIHQLQYEQFSLYEVPQEKASVLTGFENLLQNHLYKLKGKKIGIVTNQTGVDNHAIPIWERLQKIPDVTIVSLYSPEHGLFGSHAAGEKIDSEEEAEVPFKVYSLYGETRRPTMDMLKDIDLILYDIQDIGTRFYTYISTLGLLLEAAGEAQIPVMVLDRPNPITGVKIDGPVLDLTYRSFVGYYPIPVQYGLTAGELALMIIGEDWITPKPNLEVIPLIGWKREYWYDETKLLWTPTSPNIPDLMTAMVYPGTCFIEATNVSEGRGTSHPFLWIGAPWIDGKTLARSMNKLKLPGVVWRSISFTPKEISGKTLNPKYEGDTCQGVELNIIDRRIFQSVRTGIALLTVINSLYPDEFIFYPDNLNRLVGSDLITQGLRNHLSFEEIINKYVNDLEEYSKVRKKYLLY